MPTTRYRSLRAVPKLHSQCAMTPDGYRSTNVTLSGTSRKRGSSAGLWAYAITSTGSSFVTYRPALIE